MPGRASDAARPLVVHVTADHPDPIAPDKTRAIADMIALTGDRFDNHVISLNRVGMGASRLVTFAEGEAWTYRAPGRGLFHATCLRALGRRLAEAVAAMREPALLVGHKLTVEGLAVAHAARMLGVPYALTIQGDTDTKIIAARPDLRGVFARVFHEAASVVAIAPWALDRVQATLGRRGGATHVIPAPTDLDTPLPVRTGSGELLSVFHLGSRRRKNLSGLARAVRLLETNGSDVRLAVAGGGSASDVAAVRELATGSMAYIGPLERGEVAERMNRAAAFVLPSRRESLGLVFIEALFAGCPIIYPAGHGVSGFFDDLPFAIPVRWSDSAALADAMAFAAANETALKGALDEWRSRGGLEPFTRPAIAARYTRVFADAAQVSP